MTEDDGPFAFVGEPEPDPFAFTGMSDREVIERAADHFQRAAKLPNGSQREAIEMARFWRANDEYGRRENLRALRRLAEAARRRGALA